MASSVRLRQFWKYFFGKLTWQDLSEGLLHAKLREELSCTGLTLAAKETVKALRHLRECLVICQSPEVKIGVSEQYLGRLLTCLHMESRPVGTHLLVSAAMQHLG